MKRVVASHRKLCVFGLLLGCLTGCASQSIAPTAPAAVASETAPVLEQSRIAVQIGTSLSGICDQINGQIPRTISENPSHQCIQWGVYHDPSHNLQCSGAGNVLDAAITLKFRAGQRCGVGGVGHASCGFDSDPLKDANLSAKAVVNWNPAWRADVSAQLGFSTSGCNVTIARLPVSSFIKSKAQGTLDTVSKMLPAKIAAVSNVRTQAEDIWNRLSQPIPLPEDHPIAWLVLNPTGFAASAPSISGDDLTMSMALNATPEVVAANIPPSVRAVPLPNLQNGPIDSQFHAALNGFVSWGRATEIANQYLAGKEYSSFLLRHVKLEHIDIYGSRTEVIVAATVSGSVAGKIFLRGTPKYVETSENGVQREMVVVDGIDYTVETRSALEHLGDWLLHTTIRDDISKAARFDLSVHIQQLHQQLQAGLNRKLSQRIALSGTAQQPRVLGIFLRSDGMWAIASVDGTAKLAYH